ncbi:MAG TPA: hypothetical protein VGD39_12280 [Nocardioides sp.]
MSEPVTDDPLHGRILAKLDQLVDEAKPDAKLPYVQMRSIVRGFLTSLCRWEGSASIAERYSIRAVRRRIADDLELGER